MEFCYQQSRPNIDIHPCHIENNKIIQKDIKVIEHTRGVDPIIPIQLAWQYSILLMYSFRCCILGDLHCKLICMCLALSLVFRARLGIQYSLIIHVFRRIIEPSWKISIPFHWPSPPLLMLGSSNINCKRITQAFSLGANNYFIHIRWRITQREHWKASDSEWT